MSKCQNHISFAINALMIYNRNLENNKKGEIMYVFLDLVFLVFIGSMLGWILELFFRRIVHGKWVNPGLLIGPYLPIYGIGLLTLSLMYYWLHDSGIHPVLTILLMGFLMTLIEYIGGLIALKNNVKLWDYSDRWGNYKGIICPLFSAIWTVIGGLYYFLLAPYVVGAIDWFGNNLYFSYFVGIFSGVIVIDFVYSTGIYLKIQKYAKENDIVVKYEQFKLQIKEMQARNREKYSFINPFKQTKTLKEYLEEYHKKHLERISNIKKIISTSDSK